MWLTYFHTWLALLYISTRVSTFKTKTLGFAFFTCEKKFQHVTKIVWHLHKWSTWDFSNTNGNFPHKRPESHLNRSIFIHMWPAFSHFKIQIFLHFSQKKMKTVKIKCELWLAGFTYEWMNVYSHMWIQMYTCRTCLRLPACHLPLSQHAISHVFLELSSLVVVVWLLEAPLPFCNVFTAWVLLLHSPPQPLRLCQPEKPPWIPFSTELLLHNHKILIRVYVKPFLSPH